MAALAEERGKEVLLHLPMEAETVEKNRFLGPGGLTRDMSRQQFNRTLHGNMEALPHVIGVNNHMGSLISRQPDHMQWLMQSLSKNGFFYIDSLTTSNTVAENIARQHSVPYMRRDVFLDHKQNVAHIEHQFDRLIRIARSRGRALAIGHPHPQTLAVLQRRLANLDREGVMLISLRRMLRARIERAGLVKLSRLP